MNSEPARELKPQEFEFETMNLQVGVRLQVMTHRHLKPAQYFSTLIGYVKDEYLIIKIPAENGAPIAMSEGDRLTIRVFSGVNVCSFACSVERVFARPLNYVHLSFPTSIQGTSLRGAMRVKAEIPAHVSKAGSASPIACTLANVSVTGARIDVSYPLPAGSEVLTLAFTLATPPANEEVRVETLAAIRNMTVARPAPDKPDVYSYGVQFVDLDSVHYTLLQNMTYEALLADRLKIV